MSLPKPTCQQCHTEQHVLIRAIINHAGIKMFLWFCVDCQCAASTTGAMYLKHEEVRYVTQRHGKTPDDIPVIADYRELPCAICGQTGTEYHHWLPQSQWNHADVAPQVSAWSEQGAYLCKYHHDLWHDLVTPTMPGRGNSRREPSNGDLQSRSLTATTAPQTAAR